ncbi:MAG TPA: SRPBCC family protein [Flavisolibacter sp.]|jgi:uncharacterized protein YndB with AHSA1/START domain|nr:SRPBCC family protein [Flavisolibacter sp.]
MSNTDKAVIQVSKSFPVKKEELYKAWTEPGQLKQWWKPMGKQLTEVENDIRQDGSVRYQFEDNLQVSGTYKEVAEGEKLVYSWKWQFPEESIHNGDYMLTIDFKDEGEGSLLAVTQENIEQEHAIKPHEDGWNEALDALHQHVSKNG